MSELIAVVSIIAFCIMMAGVVQDDIKKTKEHQALTARCYSQGLVPVSTAAGEACADPRTFK